MGFIHPLENNKYKGVAEYIDIHLIKLDGNGLAFEMPQNFKNQSIKEGKCTLTLHIRNNLEKFPGNYRTIVTHEIFHLYQYGYSQFKGGWYIEGMTNLMEWLLRLEPKGGNGLTPLPTNLSELESNVYTVPYNQLWHRLAVLSDKTDGQLNLPSQLLSKTYIDGSKVFKDDKFKGHSFIKKILENMELKSNEISFKLGRDKHDWTYDEQRSFKNRPQMLNVIQETMLQFGMNKTSEEIKFLDIK